MILGKRNKTKGSVGERYYAEKFRELGFNKCITSRQGSRVLDNCGIDLCFLPFNVQIKTGIHKGLNHSLELKLIEEKMNTFLPENAIEHNQPKVLIHRKQGKSGKKRTEYDDMVYMTFEDFSKIIKMISNGN